MTDFSPATLIVALQHTYSPNELHRKESEILLRKFEKAPGYIVQLLHLLSSDIDVGVRQAASIYLKNFCKRSWSASADNGAQTVVISVEDKTVVKENIVDVLIRVPPKIRIQIATTVTNIASSEFPDNWPSFLPKVAALLSTQDPAFIHGALLALYRVLKIYQYMPSDDAQRPSLGRVVAEVYPSLLQLLHALSVHDNPEAGEMAKLIVKIVEATTKMAIPPVLAEENTLSMWMNLLIQLLEKPLPETVLRLDEEEQGKHPLWKVKKWIARIMERFMKRFARIQKDDDPANVKFGKLFVNHYSVRVLNSCLSLLNVKRGGGGYLPERVAQSVLIYLSLSLRHGITYVALKPHLPTLTREILFPYLWLSDKDMELWKEDPHEYLRKELDFVQEFFNPRNASINFLTELVRYRGKSQLHQLMEFVVSVLIRYEAAPKETRLNDISLVRAKDGALVVIGIFAPHLKRIKEYGANLEKMILVHVFPEFTSPLGFLRARAVWIFSQFYNAKFENPANFGAGVRQVLAMFRDPDLPVRMQAALSLRYLVKANAAITELRPMLPQVLEEYFNLMHEIEHDDVITTLEILIEQFGEEMAPYAVGLCARLSEVFTRYYNTSNDDENVGTFADAPLECLSAISALLNGLRSLPQAYQPIETVLMPILHRTLDPDGIGYLEDILDVITYLTFYSTEISPQLWTVFPKIYNAVMDWAVDFVEWTVAPFDNFINKGSAVFLNPTTPYLGMVFNIYKKVVADVNIHETEAGEGCRIMESVFHNCRRKTYPAVDAIVAETVEVAVGRLAVCHSKPLKILLLDTIANALYYNPPLTLHVLHSKGMVANAFTVWFQMMPKIKNFYDKKLNVLGLSAIFTVKFSELPPLIQQGSNQILAAVVKLISQIEEHKKLKELEKLDTVVDKSDDEGEGGGEGEDGEEAGSDEEYEGIAADVPDDQDVTGFDSDGDEGEEEFKMMATTLSKRLRDGGAYLDDIPEHTYHQHTFEGAYEEEGSDDELEGDDDDDDDEEDEDEEYSTPIDDVDELVFFANTLTSGFDREYQTYQSLMGALTIADQQSVQLFIEKAKERVAATATANGK